LGLMRDQSIVVRRGELVASGTIASEGDRSLII